MRMRAVISKNARLKKEQDDADRLVWQKKQETNANISARLEQANMLKSLYEWRHGNLLDKKYKEDENVLGGLKSFKKYKPKEDMSLKERFTPKGGLESLKRLTPKGTLEETEGYKEFKAKEERGEYIEETFESPEFLAQKEAFKEQALKDLDNI